MAVMIDPVRSRLRKLFDPASFVPLEPKSPSAIVCGKGRVAGRRVWCYAADPKAEPSLPINSVAHQVAFWKAVAESPHPVVMLIDAPAPVNSAGGKTPIPPGAGQLLAGQEGVGHTFFLQARLGKSVPQVAVVLGKAGAALSFPVGLAHCRIMVEGGAVCIGRPDAVHYMIGQETDFERLGGTRVHFKESGLADMTAPDEDHGIILARRWLELIDLPKNAEATAMPSEDISAVASLVEAGPDRPFDMHRVIHAIVDDASFLELAAGHGRECIVGLARVAGYHLGIVANNSAWRAGILFPTTCRKMSQFIRFCGNFNIPLVFLADCPGFMVGETTEREGMVKAGADLFTALAEARAARLCLVVRRAYTAGLYAMGGSGFKPDRFLALPTASISIFGKKALDRFAADRNLSRDARQAMEQMTAQSQNPAILESEGHIDRVIEWNEIRNEILGFLSR